MPSDRTLAIIKPDALGRRLAGKVIAHLEEAGFRLAAARVVHLSAHEAGAFYGVHRERPFYTSLVSFMTSGPCMPVVLVREDAVATLRHLIGATDPS